MTNFNLEAFQDCAFQEYKLYNQFHRKFPSWNRRPKSVADVLLSGDKQIKDVGKTLFLKAINISTNWDICFSLQSCTDLSLFISLKKLKEIRQGNCSFYLHWLLICQENPDCRRMYSKDSFFIGGNSGSVGDKETHRNKRPRSKNGQ